MIKFIDLFCGLGGFRLGLDKQYFECVYSCDIDDFCKKIYFENFGDIPDGDITKIDYNMIPDHDLLVGGFPCPAFSVGGLQGGFNDDRGKLIFNIFEIIKIKKPKVVFLENVKNVIHHDSGKTLNIIKEKLKELGYNFTYEVFDAVDFGLPQIRKRAIMIASRDKSFDFSKVERNRTKLKLIDFLDKDNSLFRFEDEEKYAIIDNGESKNGSIFCGYIKSNKSNLETNIEKLRSVSFHNKANRIYSINGFHPTLVYTEKTGRYFIYNDNKVRRLTINECFRITGFPENYKKIGAKYLLYRSIGNSIAVPMVKAISGEIKKQLFD